MSNANEKTLLCSFWEIGCPRGSRCTFAHGPGELRVRTCPHREKCYYNPNHENFDKRNRPCMMAHPGENLDSQAIYERAVAFAKPISKKMVLKHTKMCRFAKTGCPDKDCNHAHKDEECRLAECPYGSACPGDRCTFYHTGKNAPMSRSEIVARAYHGVTFVVQPKDIGASFVVRVPSDWNDEDELTDEDFKVSLSASEVGEKTQKLRASWAHVVKEEVVPEIKTVNAEVVAAEKGKDLMGFLKKCEEEAAEKRKITEIVMANMELFQKHGKWILEKL